MRVLFRIDVVGHSNVLFLSLSPWFKSCSGGEVECIFICEHATNFGVSPPQHAPKFKINSGCKN